MRATFAPLLILAPLHGGCAVTGPEGFFLQLFGRVYDEHDGWVEGADVSLAGGDGALIAECRTDAQGWYSAAVLVEELYGHTLRVAVSADGYAGSEAWLDLDLQEGVPAVLPAYPPQTWSAWSRQLPAIALALEVNAGQAEGLVVDALTGEPPVEEQGGPPLVLDVELREGWNAPDSERVVATYRTGTGVDAGRFRVGDIPSGLYTARIPGTSGFAAARFPVLVRSTTPREVRAAVSPALPSDEVRAALLWGASPADLNLHITGPRASVTDGESEWERFHVWAGAPYHPANASDVHERVVAMERTDDDGAGPESVAVYDVRAAGAYRFSVHDPAHAGEAEAEELSWSGALLQLWLGTQEPAFFEISPGQPGDTWIAAEWDNVEGRLFRLQDLSSVEDEADGEAF